MAIIYSVIDKMYIGLSTDTKLTNVDNCTKFYETDTRNLYMFDGTAWQPYDMKFKDLGLVIDTTNMAAGATVNSNWFDNLQWVRNVITLSQSDQVFDVLVQKRTVDGTADTGSLAPNTLGTNQSATNSSNWRNLTGVGQIGALGCSARFSIKNSSASANTFARLRVQLLAL